MCICACVCMSMNQGESHRMHMMHRASCGGVGAGGCEVKIFAVSICSTQERRLANSQANISTSFCVLFCFTNTGLKTALKIKLTSTEKSVP